MVVQQTLKKGCFAEWVLKFLWSNLFLMLKVRKSVKELRVLSELFLEEACVGKLDRRSKESELACDKTSSLVSKHHLITNADRRGFGVLGPHGRHGAVLPRQGHTILPPERGHGRAREYHRHPR